MNEEEMMTLLLMAHSNLDMEEIRYNTLRNSEEDESFGA